MRKKPRALVRFALSPCKGYYIYSFEHRQWWKPGGYGYTPQVKTAGIFSEVLAKKYVDQANRFAAAYLDVAICVDLLECLPPAFFQLKI